MLRFLLVVVVIATLGCHGFPRYHRLRREAESVKYGPCKNTYDQCPEWKGEGMCASEQYKDYMMTVCPVTCEFCKESSGGTVTLPDDLESGTAPKPSQYAGTSAKESEGSGSPPISQQQTAQNTNAEPVPQVAAQPTVASYTEGDREREEYQQMLKGYYQNVKQQQEAYEKSISAQYPELANNIEQPSNSDAIVAAAPASPSAPAPVAQSGPSSPETQEAAAAPAPAAPQPEAPPANAPLPPAASASQAPDAQSNGLPPPNVPNVIASATGMNKPIIIMRPEQTHYDPVNTSSALYSKEKSKPAEKSGENDSEADDSTNEKVSSESKHLQQNIQKVKQKVKTAAKQLSKSTNKQKQAATLKKGKKLQQKTKTIDDEEEDDDDVKEDSSAKPNFTAAENSEGEDEDDTEEDLQEYDSKRTKMTAPKIIVIKNSSVSPSEASTKKSISASGSGSGSSSDIMAETATTTGGEDSDASGNGSGSGGNEEGALESDLKELSFLTGLNFEDSAGAGDLETEYDSILSRSIENHARDEIDEPEENFYETHEEETREENAAGDEEAASESGEAESGASEESGNSESGSAETEDNEEAKPEENTEEAVVSKKTKEATPEAAEEEGESGESNEEESEEGDKEDAEAVQPVSQEDSKQIKEKISLVLKQNFKSSYKNSEDASYQMLEGNVKRDFEKALALKSASIKDVTFSEGNIEGNPRQTGKTKVALTLVGSSQSLMKKLAKMVDSDQSINGLSVVAGSLDIEDE